MRPLIPSMLALTLLALGPPGAAAQTPRLGQLEANASPLTVHFAPSDEHKTVWLLGLTNVAADGTVVSGAVFSNSFGQASVTAQWGQRQRGVLGHDKWYWQWTVGPVYGYAAPYNRKVPLNYRGLSPVVIPSLGYQLADKAAVQLSLLGNSALMLQLAWQIPDR